MSELPQWAPLAGYAIVVGMGAVCVLLALLVLLLLIYAVGRELHKEVLAVYKVNIVRRLLNFAEEKGYRGLTRAEEREKILADLGEVKDVNHE